MQATFTCTDGQFTAGRRGAAGASGWARAPAWVATTTMWTICSSRRACHAHHTPPGPPRPARPRRLRIHPTFSTRTLPAHSASLRGAYLRRPHSRAQAGSAYRAEPVGVELTLNGLQFSEGGLLYEYEAEPVAAEVEAAPLPATE